jgi:hypothetical protein
MFNKIILSDGNGSKQSKENRILKTLFKRSTQ